MKYPIRSSLPFLAGCLLAAMSAIGTGAANADDRVLKAVPRATGPHDRVLDLTPHAEAFDGFRDCLMHLRKEGGAYSLVGSRAAVEVPQGAILGVSDRTWAYLGAKGFFLKIPFSQIAVPVQEAGEAFAGTWSGLSEDRKEGLYGSHFSLALDAPEAQVRKALEDAWGMRFAEGYPDGPDIEPGAYAYYSVGDYPRVVLESPSGASARTDLYFYCVLDGSESVKGSKRGTPH